MLQIGHFGAFMPNTIKDPFHYLKSPYFFPLESSLFIYKLDLKVLRNQGHQTLINYGRKSLYLF